MNKIITLIFMIGFENLLQASWCSAISCSSTPAISCPPTPIEYLQQDKDLKDGFDLLDKNYEEFINRYVYVGDYQKEYENQEIKEIRNLAIKTISDGMSPQLQAILKILNQKEMYVAQLEKKDKDIFYYAIAHKNFSFNIDPIFEEIFNEKIHYSQYILDLIKQYFILKSHDKIIANAKLMLKNECENTSNVDMIKFLIYYVDVNTLYDDHLTPLLLVARYNKNNNANKKIAQYLIDHGADVYAIDKNQQNARALAFKYNDSNLTSFFIMRPQKKRNENVSISCPDKNEQKKEVNSSCNIS